MSDHDQHATPAARPDDRPMVLLPDEAALVPAHLLSALLAPGPEGTADPDPAARAAMADWARDDVIEAHAALLGELHDIDFHNYADGCRDWYYSGRSVEQIATDAVDLAERARQVADQAQAAVTAAVARRDWLRSGRPLRCLGCGEVIDPSGEPWRVCRGFAEHDWCHHDQPNAEDDQRGWTVEEAEGDAYSEDRLRSGGPYPGDVVEVTYPGPSHPHPSVGRGRALVTAIWETDPANPDGPGRARIDTSGLILAPDGSTPPAPGHETPNLLDLTGATSIRIIHTSEDLQDEADLQDDPELQEPTDLDDESPWVGVDLGQADVVYELRTPPAGHRVLDEAAPRTVCGTAWQQDLSHIHVSVHGYLRSVHASPLCPACFPPALLGALRTRPAGNDR